MAEIQLNQIILADCMDIMRDIPDKYFELAIVDPPYGIDRDRMNMGAGGGVAKHNTYKMFLDKPVMSVNYINTLLRISKNQIIWGGNYFILPPTKGWIVWKKMDIKNDFSPIEMAWTSDLRMGFFDFLWAGMWQENMSEKEIRIHPTQKPVALYRWLLQNYAKPGDKIIDTHSGSGSCAIACHIEKHDFLAIEKDADYHAASVKRLEEVRAQGVLF